MSRQSYNHCSKASYSRLCKELIIDDFESINSYLHTQATAAPYFRLSIQEKFYSLFLYAKKIVTLHIIFFLAISLILTGCMEGAVSRPVVFVDAEEYSTDGIEAYENAEWNKAQRFFNKALQLYQGIDYQEGVLLSYINLAEVALALHDYIASNKYLMRAEETEKYGPLQHYSSRIALLYGLIALQKMQLTEAENIILGVLPAFEGTKLLFIPDTTQLAAISSLTKIAFLNKHNELLWTSRYANALKRAADQSTDREARLLRFQSSLLLLQGADQEAESKSLQALFLYKSKQSRNGIAATLLELAQFYRSKQRWHLALDYFTRSKAVYKFLGDVEKVALINNIIIQVQSNIDK